jgi:predicted naringenin-chalcone synthase
MTEYAALLGLGTALPRHTFRQEELAALLARLLADDPAAAERARFTCRKTGVETRHSCLPDFSPGFGGIPFGAKSTGTAERMAAFREHAPALGAEACRRALAGAELEADEISHLVAVTSTGFFSPGLDVVLIESLGLRAGVERALVGFMGCEGFPSALALAKRIVASERAARVLLACVELPTLHFRLSGDLGDLVAQALFGDAAAALVLGGGGHGPAALAELGASVARVAVDPDARAGWEIGNEGLRFDLPRMPDKRLWGDLREIVAPLLEEVACDEIAWCVHPADPVTLASVERALGLPQAALSASWRVLRRVGSVISCGSVFALAERLATATPGESGILLGVRPGLSVQASCFRAGARRVASSG